MGDANQQDKPATGYPSSAQPSYPPGQAATSYPYPAHPHPYPTHPHPYPYTYPNPTYPRPTPGPRATFLRRLIVSVIAFFLILGSISFILWLVFRPRLPQFSVSAVSVSPLNISSSSSSSQLSADWVFTLSVRNPNSKMSVDYSAPVASVLYRSYVLAETTLPPFFQAKRNSTSISARLASASTYVDDSISREIASDRSRGSVEFNLRIFSWVRFETGAWRTRRHPMRVFCPRVRVGFSSPSSRGSLSGTSTDCYVDL